MTELLLNTHKKVGKYNNYAFKNIPMPYLRD